MSSTLRILYLGVILLFISSSSWGQNWQSLSSASDARWLAGGLRLEDKFYVLSGFTLINNKEFIVNSLEVYDISNDAWTSLTPMPISKYETDPTEAGVTHTTNVLVSDTIWVLGGRTGKNPGPVTEEVWLYDIKTDNWSAGPDLPIPLANGYCVNIGRTLHYIGGFFNACTGMSYKHYTFDIDAWLADPVNAKWEDYRAPLPEGKAHLSVVALGGKIYAFAGELNHDCCPGSPVYPPCREDQKDGYVYDLETDVWTPLPDLPYIRSHAELNSFALDGKVYQVGSETGVTTSKTTLVYDPALGTWSEEASWEFPNTIHLPAVTVYKDSLIVSHGGNPSRGVSSTITQYTQINRSPVYELGWGKDTLDFWVYQGLSAKQKVLAWTLSAKLLANLNSETTTSWLSAPATINLDVTASKIPVEVNSSGLASGTYYSNLILSGNGEDVVDPSISVPFSPDTIVVKLTVGPSPDGVLLMEQEGSCEEIELGTTATIPVKVFTPGATPISLTASSLSDASFNLANPLPATLPANGEALVDINFSPTATGNFSPTFNINHSGSGASSSVVLNCEAIPPCVDPPNWVDVPLGTPTIPGSACQTGNIIRMSAGGNNIWSRNDEGRFFATQVSGDGEMIIKVNSATEADEDTKIGIMFRESLDDDAANVFFLINPNHYLTIQYRPGTGQGSYREIAIGYYPPHWLKLVRQGNVYTPYESEDGITWNIFNNNDIPINLNLKDTLYAGIAFTSHDENVETFAELESVSVNFSQTIFPVVLESFEGKLMDRSALLNWKVSLEENFSHYEVQRKTDYDLDYQSLGIVNAAGKSTYEFWDRDLQIGKNVYRLAMLDIDGQVEYSRTIELELDQANAFDARIINELQSLELKWYAPSIAGSIGLIDITGKHIWKKGRDFRQGARDIIPLPGLSAGYYVLEVKWEGRSQRKLVLLK
ncbi:MAG: kelch repeat-containing protein [Bacteroidia bacterium]|nr:kelch repeat-containing protein [Bacteroidia bacterium]